MRVLQVITDAERRGAQVFATELQGPLVARGFDVDTVSLTPGTNPALDVNVLGRSPLGVATLGALRNRARRADVVVAHGSTTLPAVAVATIGLRTRFCYRQISDSLFWADTRARRVRVRLGLHRARLIVALWEDAGQILQRNFGVPRRKIRIVPNGVRASAWHPATAEERSKARLELGLRDETPVVAFIGALTAEKGPDLAVQVTRHLEDAQLLIVGSGPEAHRVRSLVTDQLAGRAVMVGGTPDLSTVYAAADVLLCPSRSEGMPAVVIEAGLCGIPVVASAVGALPHMIDVGSTGELVPAADLPRLTRAVQSLLDDPVAAREMGQRARQRFLDRYDIERLADAWARIIADAAGPWRDDEV